MASSSDGDGFEDLPRGGRDAAASLDAARCEALVGEVLAGRSGALDALTQALWPFWEHTIRRSRALGPWRRDPDAIRDLQTSLLGKLTDDDHKALRQYRTWAAENAGKTFEDWMRIVSANLVRSYVRKRLAERRSLHQADGDTRRILSEFFVSIEVEDPGFRPPYTPAQTARALLQWAESRLPEEQWRALGAWLKGAEPEEIAAEVGGIVVDGEAARKAVRAALATLRRRFGDPGPL